MAANAESGDGRHGRFRRLAPWAISALMLLLPLIAMQVTDEVDWNLADFGVFGAMLFVACGAYESAARAEGDFTYRAAVGVAVVTAFVLVWLNLAVGILGSENDPANLMYGGVLAAGLLCALVVRFRAHGMARALVVTALAQTLVGVIALTAGSEPIGGNRPGAIVALTGFFASSWLLSAWLFRKAARGQTSADAAL